MFLLVQKSINLIEQQQQEVIELKRMFLQKIEPIMEERKMLNVQIQSNLPHDTFATKNALTYIKVRIFAVPLHSGVCGCGCVCVKGLSILTDEFQSKLKHSSTWIRVTSQGFRQRHGFSLDD